MAFLRVTLCILVLIGLQVASTALDNGITPIIRIKGDLDVLALLHYRANADGLLCVGPYRHRVPYDVETLRYALKIAQEKYFSERGISLGLTVVNPCGSPAIALRDAAAAISGTNTDLGPTGPTIGILLPGIGDVTKLIIEQISQPLGLTTIGYFPTEEVYLGASPGRPSAEKFVDISRGDIGNVNVVVVPDDSDPTASATDETTTNRSTSGEPTTKPTSNTTDITSMPAETTSTSDAITPTSGATTTTPGTTRPTPGETMSTSGAASPDTGATTPVGTDETGGDTSTTATQDQANLGNNDGGVFDVPVDPDTTYVWSSQVPLSDEAIVIRRLLNEAQWSNVGLLYSGYGTGPSRRRAFLEQAGEGSICVPFERVVPRGITQEDADEIVAALIASPVRVLVWLIMNPAEIATILRSLRLTNARFYSVAGSEWRDAINNGVLTPTLLMEADGTIFIDNLRYVERSEGLETHLQNLEDAASENLWLNRTLDALPNSTDLAFVHNTNSLIRAVDYLASATEKYLAETCGSREGVCQEAYDGATLGYSIFDELQGLTEGGRFAQDYGVNLINGSKYVEIGLANRRTTNLTIDLVSTFGAMGRSDGCRCINGSLQPIEASDPRWTHTLDNDPWLWVVLVVAAVFGLVAVALVGGMLWFWTYPAMIKSTVIANLLLVLGVMMMYFIPLLYTRVPNELVCGFRQFGTAFIYAWVFAALLVRSIGTHITLGCKKEYLDDSNERKNKLNKRSQVALFLAFMAPQIALSVQWIVMAPPEAMPAPDVCGEVVCNVSNTHIVLSMIYVYILVLVTWGMSCSRIREAGLIQESRSTVLATLCSMFLLVAWAVAFVRAEPEYRIPTLCLAVTANATVILLACFGPVFCVLTFGNGRYKPQRDEEKTAAEDAGDEIAYVNPAFLGTNNDESATHL